MKAVFLDYATMAAEQLDDSPLFDALPDLQVFPSTSDQELGARLADAEIVLVNKVRLDATSLAAASELRFIGLAATGTDNVDLAAARRQGIAVANACNYCTRSVVEHVFGALLTLTHNLHRYDREARQGAWQRARSFCLLHYPIRELSALTLGIVGLGTLGTAVRSMAKAFGMRVVVARRRGAPAIAGDGRVAFEELLRVADVVSLHCPLNSATAQLIAADELSIMKSDAILINTARGGLVDAAALAEGLATNTIGGAAIDVLDHEPPTEGNPLLDYEGDNLLLTPHIAWATTEARQNVIAELTANVTAFLNGRERNRVV